ncbi:hypothetical protein [Devosia neptuniae]|uniref:hypothetical protein n=1 Tax=Devosia neptuniae TaxID=191302 RepID=UPI0022AE9E85|nr:hypothetical protein [Devosia neptuniae]MCZ4346449.1 hypothetical protein [Devosia neptuniae]
MNSSEDAVLSARELYLSTGDVRFAAIAIGKAGSHDLPEWALVACRKYATEVANARPSRRKKTMNEGQLKRGYNENAYEKLLDRFELDHRLEFETELKALEAELNVAVDDAEAFRKWMRRQWSEDVTPEEPWIDDGREEPLTITMRHRRLHERALLTARGHRPRPVQGQK